jgi:glycosyltransferase involved in cell wall biosynthesis
MVDEGVSALLPIHAGLDPQHLVRALGSLANQTRPPDEVVVVEDGPVTDAHRDALRTAARDLTRVVSEVLAVNQGAGVANQAGLLRCSMAWVLKVDGDDVSREHRIERQLEHAVSSGAGVVGTAMLEFRGSEDNVVSLRVPPLTHRDIARRMRWNNPMNHPTTLYRRAAAVQVGGYGALRYMQDYDLFARMLAAGARFANLAEPLVLFRAGDAVLARRRSAQMRRCEWQLQRNLRQYGIIGRTRRYANFAARQGARTLPAGSMALLHAHLFSSPPPDRPAHE